MNVIDLAKNIVEYPEVVKNDEGLVSLAKAYISIQDKYLFNIEETAAMAKELLLLESNYKAMQKINDELRETNLQLIECRKEAQAAIKMCDEVAREANLNLMMIVTSGWLEKWKVS